MIGFFVMIGFRYDSGKYVAQAHGWTHARAGNLGPPQEKVKEVLDIAAIGM
ncbi:hypothetical protein HW571_25355 [Agrobacterium genomosp. 3]|uniref:hypothetical protein n=1 Tax=Rhizobium/Agrobacterium group TaxID=227290 RepID=UPI000AC64BD4|nr:MULTISPECIES: hypothetical protein [Rhizobium/Agrobacterium group]MCA1868969.1 hypothetical protein [Agrobacterium tomkonis]MBP8940052.1 hypothetical protein [Agrobacterium sp.]MCA1879382.1 hypothetical protein [Agrobacterium tumefaciens]MCA1894545.1 hypothetical protein [Agrobacterium tomkonis]MCA2374553.1 hypothetical protein [Agrobacterium tomkonis CIP 111-78]